MRLTKKGFRAWLEAKQPRQFVGCAQSLKCPLYLYTQSGLFYSCGKQWVNEFLIRIDDLPFGPVTARRCLRILDEIEGKS